MLPAVMNKKSKNKWVRFKLKCCHFCFILTLIMTKLNGKTKGKKKQPVFFLQPVAAPSSLLLMFGSELSWSHCCRRTCCHTFTLQSLAMSARCINSPLTRFCMWSRVFDTGCSSVARGVQSISIQVIRRRRSKDKRACHVFTAARSRLKFRQWKEKVSQDFRGAISPPPQQTNGREEGVFWQGHTQMGCNQ